MFKIGDHCIITNVLIGTRKGPLPHNTNINPVYKEMLGDEVTIIDFDSRSGCVIVSDNLGHRRTVFPWRLSLDMLEANE